MKRAVILLLPLLLLADPAQAASKTPKSAQPQQTAKQASGSSIPAARPVYEPDGSFGFCIADQTYPDDKKLTVAYSPENQINLGVYIPKGGFKIGSKYDLTLVLDEEEGRKVRAEALDEETLLLQMGSNPTFRKKFSAAKNMKVGSSVNMVPFALPPMDKMLEGLKKCIAEKAGTKNEQTAKLEHALPETLKSLLLTAGFTDIMPLLMDDIPRAERPADFMWRTGNLMAGVRERVAPEGKSLSELVGLHIKGLKEKCDGSFRAEIGREQTVQELRLRLVEASCTPKGESKDKAVMVAMVSYLTNKGVFTVFTHEGLIENKQEALAARDKLGKTLLSLANSP